MALRSLELWREHEQRWRRSLFRRTGLVWMVQDDDAYEAASLPHLRDAGVTHEKLDAEEIARRFPQMNPEGLRWGIFENDAGYLLARRACEAVVEAFVSRGGIYEQAHVEPGAIRGGKLAEARLSDGRTLTADAYVFACGPWLGRLLPEVPGARIRPSRQEVFVFGTPAGDRRFEEGVLPVWADHGARFWYGIPGSEGRGFKVADDTRGEDFDPTSGERVPSAEGLRLAREYVEHRFPGMKGAPLIQARVCQYENSSDGHFLADRHPEAENLWLVGGGSGHGFKHGPALGEHVAERVLGEKPVERLFSVAR